VTVVAVIVVLVLVAFLLGVVAPQKSRRAQQVRDRVLRRGERKGDRNAGVAGDAAEGALRLTRKAGDRTAEAGRAVNEKVGS
jgi:type II secretory pathway pseudopilin PulG